MKTGSRQTPLLVLIAAPSGAGKSTLCDMLLDHYPDMHYSISCTTRAPRGREVNGTDYYFLSADEFDKRSRRGDFLEEAVVHDNRYATPREYIETAMREGRDVLLDIDVQGARKVRQYLARLDDGSVLKNSLVDVFVMPPSLEELRRRLVLRAEDNEDAIRRRLANADLEMACSNQFRHVIVNDTLERAFAELCGIIETERASRSR